jgi:superfamily II DNA/RNA helicase
MLNSLPLLSIIYAPLLPIAILPKTLDYDVFVQAPSGAGKTAAYCIAVLKAVDLAAEECQAVVLTPTRELALGICECFSDF